MTSNEALLDFEADCERTPENFKTWWVYILYIKRNGTVQERNLIYERSLWRLPHSYKIWFNYLQDRMQQVYERCIDDVEWEAVNEVFEKALVFMNKMPRIWMEYCQFLLRQYKLTDSRLTLDRALKSLPITQHDKIWKIYLKFINQPFIPNETAIRCWKRYLQLEPYQVEDFVEYLDSKKEHTELINALIRMLNNPDFVSVKGKTKHEYWVKLCTLLSQQSTDLLFDNNLKAETIIRSGISKFPAEVGQLWCALADFNIRLGRFDVARDVYEEGVTSVVTVKDFTQIFDCYIQFEETLLTSKMQVVDDETAVSTDVGDDEATKALMKACDIEFTEEEELDLRMERMTLLLDRRPEVLNSVLLRQNPHNVYEWSNRIKLFENNPQKMVSVYTEAIRTVDPARAIGKPHVLWVKFAKYYEESKQLELARLMFSKASEVNFKHVDDLATVFTEYADFEIRHENFEDALVILRKATATNFTGPPNWKHDPDQVVQERVWKSVKLWSFYVDLDESVANAKGQIQSTKLIYERMVELKVCTPQTILNYANMLQEHNYWEESFRAYEKGLALFKWPQVYDIWMTYLTRFIKRYRGTKLERARDLFEQAVKAAPPDMCRQIYLLYAKAEEDFGLTKRAMDVYSRATDAVKDDYKLSIYFKYINKAQEYFGVASTRAIYEKAIESLPNKMVPSMCIKYAQMEIKLGEVDRARALYQYGAQLVNPDSPTTAPEFWNLWQEFELNHGNQQTFKEMLRIRRSVQATYNTGAFVATKKEGEEEKENDATEEHTQEQLPVDDETGEKKGLGQAPGVEAIKFQAQQDPAEIDIGGDDEDDAEEVVDDDKEAVKVEDVDDGNPEATAAGGSKDFQAFSQKLRREMGVETEEDRKKRKAEHQVAAAVGPSKRTKL